ncbi:MAG: precorrin-4 C(11)-methyltransferase [Firmicutes bacterium]|nr:precorrin-4 C(11)-methyltransferase [Bacillota bacterium]
MSKRFEALSERKEEQKTKESSRAGLGKVYFVGAGPGDPDLITIKGKKLLEKAGLVIYAGSLVNPALLSFCHPKAKLIDSAPLTLEEIMKEMEESVRRGELVVRLHSGDPSLFGAVQEQMDWLSQKGILFELVPGVSSFQAAAARLKREYTLPGISQTLILSRIHGRTPVPEREKLRHLAVHRSSLVLFLSVLLLKEAVAELLAGGYPPETPVAVVEKVSWPEERVLAGTLADILGQVEAAGISRTALVLVGDFLQATPERSRLYDPAFAHGYREKEAPD